MAGNEIFSQIKALFKNLSLAKKITLAGFVGGTALGLILLMNWAGSPDFQLLYSNLDPEDAGAIVSRLKEQRIPYRLSSNGRSILAPGEKIYDLRLELAANGLPRGSGVGFEIFDNTKLGMTEFVQNVNYQRALQGELSRTIDSIDGIEGSRIHIVMPSRSLFLEQETPASASVVLRLRPGRWLTKDQVQAIVHLVSSSISGLNPEDITIVDNYGKMLSGTGKKSESDQITSEQMALQEKMDRRLEKKIQSMLEAALGPGKAIARVSCALDFRQEEKREEIFSPDKKVIRSEQLSSERSGNQESGPSGVPGILSNTQAKAALEAKKAETSSQSQSFVKQDRTVNYEISKVTSHVVEPFTRLKSISAAVVVDGIHKYITGKDNKGEWKYFPRSQEEMAKLEKIVKRAINFDASRGDSVDVVNLPFETEKHEQEETAGADTGWLSTLRKYAPSAKLVSLSIFLFLSFVFVIRPLIRWITAKPAVNEPMLAQLPKTVAEIESETGKSMPNRDQALRLLMGNQEDQTLELMRGWMQEEEA